MAQRRRWKLSVEQKAELWSRWKSGQSLNEIGRALDKDHVVVQFFVGASRGDRSAGAGAAACVR